METLAAQIGHAVDGTGAERLVLDSLNSVLSLQEDVATARQLLRALISSLRRLGLTVVLTVETPGDPGGTLSRYGVEEFVADNVVLLRNVREGTFRRRTLQVLKMRGAMHHKGDVGFTILPGQGVVVLPVTAPHAAPDLRDAGLVGQRRARPAHLRRVHAGVHHPAVGADGHRQDLARDAVRRRGRRAR